MSSGALEYLMQRPELLSTLSKEQLEMLMELVRMEKARLRNSNAMPDSAFSALVEAVPDSLVRDLVGDARRSNDPGFLKPKEGGAAVVKGSGWTPLDPVGPPSGIRYIDEMCDAQDQVDKAERMKGFGLAGLGGPRVLTKDES